MPGSSVTIERRCPIIRLNSVDFPTFGRPMTAMRGSGKSMRRSEDSQNPLSFCTIAHQKVLDLYCLPVIYSRIITVIDSDLKTNDRKLPRAGIQRRRDFRSFFWPQDVEETGIVRRQEKVKTY